MLVTVTGATGHLGANLVRHLLDGGHRVRALVYDDDVAIARLPIERVAGDVCAPSSLDAAFAGAEIVYHVAGAVSLHAADADLLRRVNVHGTGNVVDACIRRGVKRLVHVSSIHASVADPRDSIVDETRPLALEGRAHPYDRSKAEGELEIQAAVARGLDAVIVCPTGVLGPHDHRPSHMGRFLLELCQGRMPVLVDGGFTWVDARDVAAAAVLAAERGRRGERYLLASEWASAPMLAGYVERATGARVPRVVVPLELMGAFVPFLDIVNGALDIRSRFTAATVHALATYRQVSIDKAKRELGFRPRPVADTVADTIRWFELAGMLETRPLTASR